MKKLVSIISPVYNGEKYLDLFIKSIIEQTYSNFELILIDDGSSDKSKEIINKHVQKDNRIKYYYQNNAGAPKARNYGLSIAKGDLIYIPDCDDIVPSYTLQVFVDNMTDDIDIVMGNFIKIDTDGVKISDTISAKIVDLNYNLKSNYMFVVPFPGNKCFSRNIIKTNKMLFDDVKIAQDLNFYLKACLVAKGIKYVNMDLYYYRATPNSISRSYSLKIFDITKCLDFVTQFYKNNNATKSELNNIEFLRLYHYYTQLCKILNFSKNDQRKVYLFFKNEFKKLKFVKKYDNFIYHKKIYNLYRFRIGFDFILSNSFYRNYIRKIIRGKHE